MPLLWSSKKTGDKRYRLSHYNTGDLLEKHYRLKNSPKFQTFDIIENVPEEDLLQEGIWENSRRSASEIYHFVRSTLGKNGTRLPPSPHKEDYEARQEEGTCLTQCLMAMLRHQIMELAEGTPQEKLALYKMIKSKILIRFYADNKIHFSSDLIKELALPLEKHKANTFLYSVAEDKQAFGESLASMKGALQENADGLHAPEPDTTLLRFSTLRQASSLISNKFLKDEAATTAQEKFGGNPHLILALAKQRMAIYKVPEASRSALPDKKRDFEVLIGERISLADYKISMTQADVQSTIKEDIENYFYEFEYNSLHTVQSLIAFYDTQKKGGSLKSEAEIFSEFQPNSKEETQLKKGSHCVGIAHSIVRLLKEKYLITSHIVCSTNEKKLSEHAAVVIPCKIGVVLVDVNSPYPLVALRQGKKIPLLKHLEAETSFDLIPDDSEYKITRIEKKGTHTTYNEFPLRADLNPDQTVIKRWLATTEFFPVVARDQKGKERVSIEVNIRLNKITLNMGNQKYRIPFSALNPATRQIDTSRLQRVIYKNKFDEKGVVTREEVAMYFADTTQIIQFFGNGPGYEESEFFSRFQSPEVLLDQIFAIKAHDTLFQKLFKIL